MGSSREVLSRCWVLDPTGCNYPALERVRYDAVEGVVHLQVGAVNRYPDREVVCDNASYGYTCRCVVEDGTPETVRSSTPIPSEIYACFSLHSGSCRSSKANCSPAAILHNRNHLPNKLLHNAFRYGTYVGERVREDPESMDSGDSLASIRSIPELK